MAHVPFKSRNKKKKALEREAARESKSASITNIDEKSAARMHARCQNVVSADDVLYYVLIPAVGLIFL